MGNLRDINGANSWLAYERLVLTKLDELSNKTEQLAASVAKLDTDIARLKIRASLVGVVGGSLPTLAGIIWFLITQTGG